MSVVLHFINSIVNNVVEHDCQQVATILMVQQH